MEDRILTGQSVQRTCNACKILYISPVVAGETKEGADFSGSFGRWNLPNGCEECRIWQEAFFCDPVAQIADLFCGKSTLLGPQFKTGVPESLKDLPESREVFLPCGGEDDDVIQIKQARFPVEAREDTIHEAREGGGSVAKTKWDLIKFVQLPTAGTKGGLFLITLLYWNLPKATLKIQGGKPPSSVKSIEEVIYPGQWMASLTVAALSCQKSTYKRRLPSFYLTITTGEAHGLLEGRMTSLASICWTCAISSH